jgi:hypothetical protein
MIVLECGHSERAMNRTLSMSLSCWMCCAFVKGTKDSFCTGAGDGIIANNFFRSSLLSRLLKLLKRDEQLCDDGMRVQQWRD